MKLLRIENIMFSDIMFSDATLSDINVVLCYVLSLYHYKIEFWFSGLVCTMHAFQNDRSVTSPYNTYCTEVGTRKTER